YPHGNCRSGFFPSAKYEFKIADYPRKRPTKCPPAADIVAKVENRRTLRLSRRTHALHQIAPDSISSPAQPSSDCGRWVRWRLLRLMIISTFTACCCLMMAYLRLAVP